MSEGVKVSGKAKDKANNNYTNKNNAPDLSPDLESPVGKILSLQRTIGNGAMQNLIESGIIQPKLKIGQPGDIYEREADRMAEEVMGMSDSVCPSCVDEGEKEEVVNREVIQTDPLPSKESSFVQRQVGEEERKKREEEEILQPKLLSTQITPLVQCQVEDTEKKKREEELIQLKFLSNQTSSNAQRQLDEEERKKEEEEWIQPRFISEQMTPLVQQQVEDEEKKKREEEMFQAKRESSGGVETTADVDSIINNLRGKGEPLPESTKNYFEPRFGADFSGVRIHTGGEAAKTAKSINSHAFTVGNDVVFGSSNYFPGTEGGKKLLAHELTHVVQNLNGIQRRTITGKDEYGVKIEKIKERVKGVTEYNIMEEGSERLKSLYYDLNHSLKTYFTESNEDYGYLSGKKSIIKKELERRKAEERREDLERQIENVKKIVLDITVDCVEDLDTIVLELMRDILNDCLNNCFTECNKDYAYLYSKKVIIEKELEIREREKLKEELRKDREEIRRLVAYITEGSIAYVDLGELEFISAILDYCLENCFVEYHKDYAHFSDKKALVEEELERRKAEEIYNNIISEISVVKDEWKSRLKEELSSKEFKFPDIPDWALNAIGYFKGLPYLSAHKIYRGGKWRKRYQKGVKEEKAAVFPASVVCDQLGEITQKLARGMQKYKRQGLTGHYMFYQDVDDFSPQPPKPGSSRLRPGATIFLTGKPKREFSFNKEAEYILASRDGWSWLFDSGLPREKTSMGKIFRLRKSGRLIYKYLKDETKEEMKEELAAELKKVFIPNKAITHEATVVAVADVDSSNPRLLFLDTWRREEGKLVKGTMQLRASTLAREKKHHWGYSPAGIECTDVPASPDISLIPPYSGVNLKIVGNYNTFEYNNIWAKSPLPPPIIFEYSLRNVKIPKGLKVWLEFYGETTLSKWQLKKIGVEKPPKLLRLLTLEKGKTRWKKPEWMKKL